MPYGYVSRGSIEVAIMLSLAEFPSSSLYAIPSVRLGHLGIPYVLGFVQLGLSRRTPKGPFDPGNTGIFFVGRKDEANRCRFHFDWKVLLYIGLYGFPKITGQRYRW